MRRWGVCVSAWFCERGLRGKSTAVEDKAQKVVTLDLGLRGNWRAWCSREATGIIKPGLNSPRTKRSRGRTFPFWKPCIRAWTDAWGLKLCSSVSMSMHHLSLHWRGRGENTRVFHVFLRFTPSSNPMTPVCEAKGQCRGIPGKGANGSQSRKKTTGQRTASQPERWVLAVKHGSA